MIPFKLFYYETHEAFGLKLRSKFEQIMSSFSFISFPRSIPKLHFQSYNELPSLARFASIHLV